MSKAALPAAPETSAPQRSEHAPSDGATLAYSPAVDGLRAISIISVVAFHVGIPGFSGGFVGVDVFFVISGYLIIGQILAALRAGSFSFGDFWARRVLRIAPPFYLVIACTIPIAAVILVTPSEFLEYGQETIWSSLMGVNFLFFSEQGYFDTSADTKPLLHLWTLAVEEQFYFVAPLIVYALWRGGQWLGQYRKVLWWAVVGVGCIASFVLCVLFTARITNPAFYLTPFRAWEFILGAAVPLLALRVQRIPWPWAAASLMAVVGLVAIAASVVMYDEATPYPSWRAIVPVLGAALVIAAVQAEPSTLAGRFLAAKPMVWLGLCSYSWYLWHWPLLSFVRIANFGDRQIIPDLTAAALSLVLAVCTYLLVERPVRRWRRRQRYDLRPRRIIFAGIGLAFIIAMIGVGDVKVVVPARAREVGKYLTTAGLTFVEPTPCNLLDPRRAERTCPQVKGREFGLLAGDSHAQMYNAVIANEAQRRGSVVVALASAGCHPLFVVDTRALTGLDAPCLNRRAIAIDTAAHHLGGTLSFAILAARWNIKAAAKVIFDARWAAFLAKLGVSSPPPATARLALALSLAESVARLQQLGVKRILLIAPVPEFRHPGIDCVVRADHYAINRDRCSIARVAVDNRRRGAMEALRFVAAAFPNVRVADPIELFCDGSLCRPFDTSGILYRDRDHLTHLGALQVYRKLQGDFEWVQGTP